MRAMPQSFLPPNRLTGHARARMQQRGISAAALEALLDLGTAKPAGRGREIVFFDKKARRLGSGPLGSGPESEKLRVPRLGSGSEFEKHRVPRFTNLTPNLNTYAILESDGTVITVGHRHRRLPRYR